MQMATLLCTQIELPNRWELQLKKRQRRRSIQEAYNEKHGITPKTIQKEVRDVIRATTAAEDTEIYKATPAKKMTKKEREEY